MKRRSIRNVSTYLKIARDLKLNLGLVGAHGRGKTKILQQYASENDYTLITLILSRMIPEDLLGLPVTRVSNNKTVTAYSEPEWLVKACDPNEKVLLFFDEFNNAELDVQASILNLIEDRTMGNLKLNDNTQIAMAFNPDSIAPNATELSMATRDRLCVIPIEDDKKAYTTYYTQNKMPLLTDLFNSMPEIVKNHDEESVVAAEENAEFTYRSIEKSYKIYEYCKRNKIGRPIMEDMICGYGGKAGISFIQYLDKHWGSESVDDLVDKALNKKDIDSFIKEVNEKELLEKYKNYADLRTVINRLETIFTEEEFNKFLDNCLTDEFKSLYRLNNIN